jgi:hypothetical protein
MLRNDEHMSSGKRPGGREERLDPIAVWPVASLLRLGWRFPEDVWRHSGFLFDVSWLRAVTDIQSCRHRWP